MNRPLGAAPQRPCWCSPHLSCWQPPTCPGSIKRRVKHPMLVGIILWAIGHLLANGDLASLLLFGAFLIYAILDLIAVIPRGDPAPAVVRTRSDFIAAAIGLVAFVVFGIWLHGWLFGVAPFA